MMEKIVIWPVYLDANKTKREGRIMARKKAVKSPKIVEIEKAALILRLEPTVEKEKAYPKTHWEKSGRVLMNKISGATRGETVKAISERIKEMREKKN
jgi:signal recognition particle subunit SRP19